MDGTPTQVIAHRGNSGEFPEHVLAGYHSALEQGADIIEPDLVASGDGVLFCRHDLDLHRSTDVAQRAEFADRQRSGEFSILDFRADELDQLRAVQPFAARDQSKNACFAPPRFSAMLNWAAEQAAQRAQRVLLYPELKHPQEHRARGVDATGLLIDQCRRLPAGVDVLLQCFCVDTLRQLKAATGLPVALLLDSSLNPEVALTEHGAWLDGLALSKKLLLGADGRRRVEAIHRQGLRVDVWTLRDDQPAPEFGDIGAELRHFYALGVDRIFADFPATALRHRRAFAEA